MVPTTLRTSAAATRVEDILLKTPEVAHVTTVVGYSMLSGFQNTYSFFWVTFKPWGDRVAPTEQYEAIKAHNYFNRFRRQWQVYTQAEGEFRTRAEIVGQFYDLCNEDASGSCSATKMPM